MGEQGRAREQHGCGLAEAPACLLVQQKMDEAELTMADQISNHQRVHIRQETLERRPEKEEPESLIKVRARTTDDLDPNKSLALRHPQYEKAGRPPLTGRRTQAAERHDGSQGAHGDQRRPAGIAGNRGPTDLPIQLPGALEVDRDDITNPVTKTVREANLAKTKQHMLWNQDTEEAVRAANKKMQEAGSRNMTNQRIRQEGTEVWPANLKLMVKQGYTSIYPKTDAAALTTQRRRSPGLQGPR